MVYKKMNVLTKKHVHFCVEYEWKRGVRNGYNIKKIERKEMRRE